MFSVKIETERLLLLPLSYRQLLKYLQADGSLEEELGLAARPRIISPELLEALHFAILPAVAKAGNTKALYFTLWSIIHKEEKLLLGDCCFKGRPNGKGEIEIGYGTYPDFTRKGYMTEAVGGLIHWAWTQADVQLILAETKEENIPSQRVLLRNGFSLYKRIDEMLWWQLHKPAFPEDGSS